MGGRATSVTVKKKRVQGTWRNESLSRALFPLVSISGREGETGRGKRIQKRFFYPQDVLKEIENYFHRTLLPNQIGQVLIPKLAESRRGGRRTSSFTLD